MKIILITGASRGLGEEIAQELLLRGHRVYATMRDPSRCTWPNKLPETLRNLLVLQRLDVSDEKTIQNALKELHEREGRLDVLINNAGYGLLSPVELATEDEINEQFAVNFFGPLRLIRAVLPQMRHQKSGHIINISSVAGFVSNPAMGIYSASKHALEAVSASLAATLFPWNIKVTLIEPGAMSTEFGESMHLGKGCTPDNPYGDFPRRYYEHMRETLKKGASPKEVSELVVEILETEKPNLRYQTKSHRFIAEDFLVDPTGNRWLDRQKTLFADWFPSP